MKRTTLTLIVLALVLVPIGGCGLTPDQRVAALQGAIARTQEMSLQLDSQIQAIQQAVAQANVTLADPNAGGAAAAYLREALPKLEAKLAASVPIKKLVDQQLAALQAQFAALQAAGPLDVQKEFAAYGQGVTSVGGALPPPYNTIALLLGSVGLPVIGAIAGAFAKGKQAQTQLAAKDDQITAADIRAKEAKIRAEEMETALDDVVAGGEAWKEAMKAGLPAGTDAVTAWKAAMAEAQASEVTQENVALARVRAKAA